MVIQDRSQGKSTTHFISRRQFLLQYTDRLAKNRVFSISTSKSIMYPKYDTTNRNNSRFLYRPPSTNLSHHASNSSLLLSKLKQKRDELEDMAVALEDTLNSLNSSFNIPSKSEKHPRLNDSFLKTSRVSHKSKPNSYFRNQTFEPHVAPQNDQKFTNYPLPRDYGVPIYFSESLIPLEKSAHRIDSRPDLKVSFQTPSFKAIPSAKKNQSLHASPSCGLMNPSTPSTFAGSPYNLHYRQGAKPKNSFQHSPYITKKQKFQTGTTTPRERPQQNSTSRLKQSELIMISSGVSRISEGNFQADLLKQKQKQIQNMKVELEYVREEAAYLRQKALTHYTKKHPEYQFDYKYFYMNEHQQRREEQQEDGQEEREGENEQRSVSHNSSVIIHSYNHGDLPKYTYLH